MQPGFYFDQTRCIGCHTCDVACKDWHDLQEPGVSWRRIFTTEQGVFPDVFVALLSLSCCHCAHPSCASFCPVDAITKNEETDLVVVDQAACLGKDACGVCADACSYNVPQFGAEENAKMQKCGFCPDRLEKGESPICVDACPVRALDAGPVDELEAKYGTTRDAVGFSYAPALGPSFIVNPKRKI